MAATGPETRDLGFLLHVLEDTHRTLPTDPARVYGVGFSGGGGKLYRLAAEASEQVAAIAVSGARIGFEGEEEPLWSPFTHGAEPLSLLHIHGEKDKVVPIEGGMNHGLHGIPMMEGLEPWADYLGANEVGYGGGSLPAPKRVEGFRWVVPSSKREVMGIIDPNLSHAWPKWGNDAIMAFFDRVPTR